MGISSLVKRILPAATSFVATGNPAVAFATAVQTDKNLRAEKKFKQQQAEAQRRYEEQLNMAEIFGQGNLSSIQAPMAGRTTANAGFGAGFGEFLTDVGKNIVSPFANLATAVQPFFGRSEVQQPAVTTTRQIGAQESQGSGTVQGFIGGPALGPAIGTAAKFLRSTPGQIGTGLGIGALTSFVGADGKTIRITRKMKSQYRAVLNLANGNYALAADMVGVSEDFFISVLLKRFRNDGPAVTKAALRKTKQTVRRLKSMCDMYDSLRPTATRRRAPMRRATTTLISNK